jgi:hypothetical protein
VAKNEPDLEEPMLSARALTESMIATGSSRSASLQSRDLTRAISSASNTSRRSIRALLLPLVKLASRSDVLIADSVGCWRCGGELFFLPRFIFQRTAVAKPRIEVAIFAGMEGNDLGGILGLTEFLRALNAHPAIGREYRLWLYPLCNPVGYVDGSDILPSGKDFDREIWNNSDSPEVQWIEQELSQRRFDGILSLRGDPLANRVQASVDDQTIDFVTPALAAAEQALPAKQRAQLAGFSVRKRSRNKGAQGYRGHSHKSFEIVLEVPRQFSLGLQSEIFLVSLHAILAAYRRNSSPAARDLFQGSNS